VLGSAGVPDAAVADMDSGRSEATDPAPAAAVPERKVTLPEHVVVLSTAELSAFRCKQLTPRPAIYELHRGHLSIMIIMVL
jgi:hypothetical protein